MVAAPPLRVAFFGTPEFALPTLRALIDSHHSLVAVISQPDRPKGRGQRLQPTPTKVAGEGAGVPVLQPDRIRTDEFLDTIRQLSLDIAVVAAYGKILPEALLMLPRLGMVNVHASLLPEYRGAAPVHRAVIDGRQETGVTIMRVVRELDAGPMLAKASYAIGGDATSVEVERALAELGAPLLVRVLHDLATGTAREEPQDEARATYAPKIVKSEGALDPSLAAHQIHNRVRGLHPWPLVSARIDARRYLLHRTRLIEGRSDAPGGTIVQASTRALAMAAGDGRILELLQIQPEGRPVMTARELLSGHPVRVGARVEPA